MICSRFYIILRGNVSVMHKDALEDVDLGDEGDPRSCDRSTLGNELVKLGKLLSLSKSSKPYKISCFAFMKS